MYLNFATFTLKQNDMIDCVYSEWNTNCDIKYTPDPVRDFFTSNKPK